jgi:hypothetical protein
MRVQVKRADVMNYKWTYYALKQYNALFERVRRIEWVDQQPRVRTGRCDDNNNNNNNNNKW